jgi:hypothetical protein
LGACVGRIFHLHFLVCEAAQFEGIQNPGDEHQANKAELDGRSAAGVASESDAGISKGR